VDRRLVIVGAFAAVLAVVVAGVLIARGGDDSSSPSDEPVSTDLSEKPTPAIPDEAPPSGLETEDIVEGDGATAKAGDDITVQYVGVDYETGEEFDSSWDSGQALEFKLGAGDVIPGWDQGVEGMKEGGRRELIIPPDLAYGAQGQPPAISPNATLVFVVDLVKVG
jgi:peptidylprolyl isomerase